MSKEAKKEKRERERQMKNVVIIDKKYNFAQTKVK